MFGKEGEQIEFLAGKGFFRAVNNHSARGFVNADAADLYNVVVLLTGANQTVVSCHVGFYPGYQLAGAEGLGHIVVGAQAQAADFVNIVLFG